MVRAGAALIAAAIILASTLGAVFAQSSSGGATPGGHPGCALQGSPNVFVEGAGMLRLGDVQACPHLRYEIVPNVFINGQPAVRLLPSEGAGGGADSVTIDGAPASRQGDAR